jgi:hypothetical protein
MFTYLNDLTFLPATEEFPIAMKQIDTKACNAD